jgi:hypothetical protein
MPGGEVVAIAPFATQYNTGMVKVLRTRGFRFPTDPLFKSLLEGGHLLIGEHRLVESSHGL